MDPVCAAPRLPLYAAPCAFVDPHRRITWFRAPLFQIRRACAGQGEQSGLLDFCVTHAVMQWLTQIDFHRASVAGTQSAGCWALALTPLAEASPTRRSPGLTSCWTAGRRPAGDAPGREPRPAGCHGGRGGFMRLSTQWPSIVDLKTLSQGGTRQGGMGSSHRHQSGGVRRRQINQAASALIRRQRASARGSQNSRHGWRTR